MSLRIAGLVALIALPAIALSGCGPTPAPSPSGTTASASDSASPSATPTPKPDPLPAEALLEVTGTAIAANGAVLNLKLIVLKSHAPGDATGAPRAAAVVAWCDGEIDDSVLATANYSLGEIDVSAKLGGSQIAWPNDLLVRMFPTPGEDAAMATGGGAYQIEPPDTNVPADPGYYVPHCVQASYIGGPTTGQVFTAFNADTTAAPPLTKWSKVSYGFTLDPINSTIAAGKVTVSNCQFVLTDLGKSLGASATPVLDAQAAYCSVAVN